MLYDFHVRLTRRPLLLWDGYPDGKQTCSLSKFAKHSRQICWLGEIEMWSYLVKACELIWAFLDCVTSAISLARAWSAAAFLASSLLCCKWQALSMSASHSAVSSTSLLRLASKCNLFSQTKNFHPACTGRFWICFKQYLSHCFHRRSLSNTKMKSMSILMHSQQIDKQNFAWWSSVRAWGPWRSCK